MKADKNMDWTTLYITGRGDFREEVRRKLEGSKLDFMPGYVDASSGRGFYDLYWVSEGTELRAIKEAVGSKLIWKYRLRFFVHLEEFIQSVNGTRPGPEFSDDEMDLLAFMRKSA